MRGRSVSRYKKIRHLYIGQGNEYSIQAIPSLTPSQLAAGRKRAKA